MKQRILLTILIFIVIVLVFADKYMGLEYNIGLVEYLTHSTRLTPQERTWLDEHEPLIYGSDSSTPPIRFVDPKTGQYTGVTIDYLQALSIELETEIIAKPMIWSEALEKLAAGETDICDMFPSEQRSKVYWFSDPINFQRTVIVIPRKEKSIQTMFDLEGKVVASQTGDYVNEFLDNNVKGINYVHVDEYGDLLLKLISGEADAAVGDEPVISYFLDEMDLTEDYVIVDKPLYEIHSVFSVPKNRKILQTILNKGIYALQRKEIMSKIQQKWFGISAPILQDTTDEKLLLIVSFFMLNIILASILFFTWNNELKEEVENRTEELRISRNDLQTTFDSLTHLMIVLDENLNIITVNKAFCDTIELQKSSILGSNLRELPGLPQKQTIFTVILKTFAEKKSHEIEMLFNNQTYSVSTFPLIESEDASDRILVLIENVTDLRLAEQQVLQAGKMAAIGHLAAGVAHEIRNPLGLIRNYTYLLKKTKELPLSVREKSYSKIEDAVEQASQIIDNLLNFSRLSDNQVVKVNIHGYLTEMLDLNHKILEQQNIDYNIDALSDLHWTIMADSLKTVMLNLISNAVDAMPDGGRLTIASWSEQDRLIITCTDTGVGMSQTNIDKIFNPFFTTKAPGEGTGLGLFITYNQIEKMNGRITVDSTQTVGTTFKIELPHLKEADIYGTEKEFI